jgi:hypothetical protein
VKFKVLDKGICRQKVIQGHSRYYWRPPPIQSSRQRLLVIGFRPAVTFVARDTEVPPYLIYVLSISLSLNYLEAVPRQEVKNHLL